MTSTAYLPSPARRPARVAVEQRVLRYVAGLAVATLVTVALGILLHLDPPADEPWITLPFLAVGVVAAEHLRIRFRRGGDVSALTLVEAVLAPLLFTFPPQVVVPTVALAEVLTALLRRTAWIKAVFNVAMWSLAAGVGSVTLGLLVTERGVTLDSLRALVIALTCVAVVNNTAFTIVLAIHSRQSLPAVLRGLAPIILPGWLGGWVVNVLMGMLFVLAVSGHPIAVVLFPVPLAVLHLAYRGYASTRADRLRLTGLRSAANALSEPLHPLEAVDEYLLEVIKSFECRAAALILVTDAEGYETHHLSPNAGVRRSQPRAATPLERALAGQQVPVRIRARRQHALAAPLDAAGWRDCLCAPLINDHRRLGAVVVFDQTGLEGSPAADLALLEALARETAHTIARGQLFESVLEERRKLGQIVSTTSDGIFTLDDDGAVLSWNAACEQITGLTAAGVIGRTDTMQRLRARTLAGSPTDFGGWAADPALPHDIVITTATEGDRRLSCSTSAAADVHGRCDTLVVVARDVTPVEQNEDLRGQLNRLAEAQAAQRLVVDHLQQAVAPEPPELDGVELAVTYVASDPSSPTGGDLYDWHVLPSGELHLAVVDVLGHGVAATKAALTVVHTLRFIAVEGTRLENIVARADQLLSAQDNELVATVIVARYRPSDGVMRVVAGGHPPALVLSRDGTVTQLAAPGGAIGWPAVGSDNVVSLSLDEAESLVLYTDGLIEARKNVLEGMDALTRHAAELSYLPADQLADQLVDRALSGADRRDDSLALVLRRTRTPARDQPGRWQVNPGDSAGIQLARRGLEAWLLERGIERDDPTLVAAELLANAVVVARHSVELSVHGNGERLILQVVDDGRGDPSLQTRGRALPDLDSEDGRGLFLVRALSDEVTIESTERGTAIRCALGRSEALAGAAAAAATGGLPAQR